MQPTDRTRVKRIPDRGHYDRETIHSILDAGFLCHVGFVHDGHPVVIPTAYGREADTLYIHGSAASRMQRELAQGIELCVTVTHLDGLVLARSAFHSSMNYRSVVIFGNARQITDDARKVHALAIVSEQIFAERWAEVRPPSPQELKGTSVLELSISEASAKIRTGPPKDDDEDYAMDIWAGVVPVVHGWGAPITDALIKGDIPVPEYIRKFRW